MLDPLLLVWRSKHDRYYYLVERSRMHDAFLAMFSDLDREDYYDELAATPPSLPGLGSQEREWLMEAREGDALSAYRLILNRQEYEYEGFELRTPIVVDA